MDNTDDQEGGEAASQQRREVKVGLIEDFDEGAALVDALDDIDAIHYAPGRPTSPAPKVTDDALEHRHARKSVSMSSPCRDAHCAAELLTHSKPRRRTRWSLKHQSPELSPRAFRDCVSEVVASCSPVVSISGADENRVLTWYAVSPTRNLTVRGASRNGHPSEDREAQQGTHNNRSHDHSPFESSTSVTH